MALVAPADCFQELQFALARANAQVLATSNVAEKRAIRAMKKRLQDRLYQRVHRAKREQKLHSLGHEVQALQSKIARLYIDLHRRKVAAANAEARRRQQAQQFPDGSLQDHAKRVVMQFFHVYQNGYSLSLAALQERFLRSVLATDVEGVDVRGADAFVQQWRLCDQHFALYILEPQVWKAQEVGHSVMVEVEVMLYLRFHRQTIGMLFPNLKTGHVDPELVLPLVTGTTAVAATYTFVVERSGYVSSLLVSLQLLETLRRVLGSLEDVVRLTDGSRIALGSGTITIA
ncbi:Mitochondrial import inner membrane translocase subunit Tim21 [Phytophthora cinnamomi]|uniref:Mitochondrial import inner membrane translocase subunit Tim21 n=1 Tax=Phytophthora cinnamomi TaxID=4785 RepID=UPI003559E33B|nr:Mitochondrial import inner membrane translocase subunit Tim21 [Phytophthora cinnamomi]